MNPTSYIAVGAIKAVVGGMQPRPASSISYDVAILGPDGITTFANAKPHGPRWPDTLNTVPAAVGTPVIASVTANRIIFAVQELPQLEACQ